MLILQRAEGDFFFFLLPLALFFFFFVWKLGIVEGSVCVALQGTISFARLYL